MSLFPWWEWVLVGWALLVLALVVLGRRAARAREDHERQLRKLRIREHYGEKLPDHVPREWL